MDTISSDTTSPASAPAASRTFLFTLSQWLFLPSGSSVARKGQPLMVPSTVVMLRVGSFALALPGRTRKVQELPFAASAGRKSFALKRIFEAVLVIARSCKWQRYGDARMKCLRFDSTIGLRTRAMSVARVADDQHIGVCRSPPVANGNVCPRKFFNAWGAAN